MSSYNKLKPAISIVSPTDSLQRSGAADNISDGKNSQTLAKHFETSTYLPTRNKVRPAKRKATKMPTHMSVEKGENKLKELSSEAMSFRRMKPIPVCMKGVVMSTYCSLAAVRVRGATARSAS